MSVNSNCVLNEFRTHGGEAADVIVCSYCTVGVKTSFREEGTTLVFP